MSSTITKPAMTKEKAALVVILGAAEEVDDQVRDQRALRPTDQRRRQELAQDRDEDEDAGGDDPRPDLRQQDPPEGLVRSCSEVLGRVQLVEVELLQRRVEGQRREREVDVEQDEPDTQVVVDEEA